MRRPRTRTTKTQQVLDLARREGVIRARELARRGIPSVYLRRLHDRGLLLHSGRGIYTLASRALTERHSLAEAGKRFPNAIVCLLSALQFHGLTTQTPSALWLAIDSKSRTPHDGRRQIEVVRMSGEAFRAGVEQHEIEGVPVRVCSAAKTVADCFKFRRRVGLDVALEALREFRRQRGANLDALWRFAQICRVARLLRPYMEALA